MHPQITSTQNPKVKRALTLEKSRERKKQQRFLIEGWREFQYAIQAGYTAESIFYNPEQLTEQSLLEVVDDPQLLLPVSEAVFTKLAYRDSTAGVVAVMKSKSHQLADLALSENALILVVEGVEKPGNLGALLRTGDAANLDAVIICDPLVDFYNPNVIRSSVGTVFTRQLAAANSSETIEFLHAQNFKLFCTHLQAAMPYTEADYSGRTAIVAGTEAFGLSEVWPANSTANIIIPMRGEIDSMNVSAATAVVVFEAIRQRGLK